MGKVRVVGHEGNIMMSSNRKKATFTVEIPRYNTLELVFDEIGLGLMAKKQGVVFSLPENIKRVKLVIVLQST